MESGSLKAAVKMLGPIAWISLSAGLQMLGALLFFKVPIDLILIFTSVFITFGIYMLNRFTDDEDAYNYPEQKMFFRQKSKLFMVPIVLIVASYILLAVSGRLVAWHILLVMFGIVYSVSVIPIIRHKKLEFIRFKDILLVKNIAVSVLWSFTSFAFAAHQKHAMMPERNDLIVVIAAFFLSALVNTISCDVCDESGDRHEGVKTIATCFGKKITGIIALGIGCIGCLFAGIFYCKGFVGSAAIILFYANILWTVISILPAYIDKIQLPQFLVKPIMDSPAFFFGVSLIAFAIIK